MPQWPQLSSCPGQRTRRTARAQLLKQSLEDACARIASGASVDEAHEAQSRVLLWKKDSPRRCRRGRTDPTGRSSERAGSRRQPRPHPGHLRRVPLAAARRRHAAPRQLLSRCPHAERGHLRKDPGELAGTIVSRLGVMSLCSRCPPRTTPRALAACSAALVRSPSPPDRLELVRAPNHKRTLTRIHRMTHRFSARLARFRYSDQ
jgi:hypothetical protein